MKEKKKIYPQVENPFEKVKVEDFNDDYALIAYLFATPKKAVYTKIIGRDNYIIVGGWGSGKTHLLKYLGIGSQFAVLGKEGLGKSDFVGVYIYPKVGSGYFRPFTLPDGEFKEGGEVLFGHWLNLLVLESILLSIIFGKEKEVWSISEEEEYVVSENVMSKFTEIHGSKEKREETSGLRFVRLSKLVDKVKTYRREITEFLNSRDLERDLSYRTRLTINPTDIKTFLDEIIRDIKKSISDECLQRKRFYILLDECELLSSGQQKVINTIVRQRHTTMVFKLATRPPNIVSTDTVDGAKLTDRECKCIFLDREYDPKTSSFRKLCKEVAEKRLRKYNYSPKSIEEILGRLSAEDELGKEKIELYLKEKYPSKEVVNDVARFPRIYKDFKDTATFQLLGARKKYAGFETFVMLSSGIMTQFLDLCRETFELSSPRYITQDNAGNMKVKVPLSVEIQNRAARNCSDSFFEDYIPKRARSTKSSPPEMDFGGKIQYICSALAGIFRSKLMGGFNEPEAARLEIPEGTQALDVKPDNPIRQIFEDSIRISVFQEGKPYMPKRIGGIKPPTYILNRILAPRFHTSSHPRWRTTIYADIFNKILKIDESEFKKLVLIKRTKGKREVKRKQRIEKWSRVLEEKKQLKLPFFSVSESMPVLLYTCKRIKGQPFEHKKFLISLHFLDDFIPFIETCETLGLSPSNAVIFYKDYQYPSKDKVKNYLQNKGYTIYPLKELDNALEKVASVWSIENEQLIILEDGGHITPKLHTNFKGLCKISCGAVEQTTKGIRNDEKLGRLLFPLISIPGSRLKDTFEPLHVSRAAINNIQRLLPDTNFSGKQALVAGYGRIGETIALQLKDMLKMQVTICDSDDTALLKAQQYGYGVEKILTNAVKDKFLIVGATGETVIGRSEILAMEHNVHLVSVSSEQWEFAVEELEALCSEKQEMRSKEGKKIGSTYTIRNTKRTVNLLADGYPVNFWEFESMPKEVSDLIMSLLLISSVGIATDPNLQKKIDSEIVNTLAEKYELSKVYLEYHK